METPDLEEDWDVSIEDMERLAEYLDSVPLQGWTRLYWCPEDNEVKEVKDEN